MIKTFTFSIMHFGIAFTVAYLLTGDVVVGGAVALIEPAVNTIAFYFHEKVWQRIGSAPNSASTEAIHRDTIPAWLWAAGRE
jgi:uncharacterized membrane protein